MRVRDCLLANTVGVAFIILSIFYGCFVSPWDGKFTVREQFVTALILLTGAAFVIIPWLTVLRRLIANGIRALATKIRGKLRKRRRRRLKDGKKNMSSDSMGNNRRNHKPKDRSKTNGKRKQSRPSEMDTRHTAP